MCRRPGEGERARVAARLSAGVKKGTLRSAMEHSQGGSKRLNASVGLGRRQPIGGAPAASNVGGGRFGGRGAGDGFDRTTVKHVRLPRESVSGTRRHWPGHQKPPRYCSGGTGGLVFGWGGAARLWPITPASLWACIWLRGLRFAITSLAQFINFRKFRSAAWRGRRNSS